jgi:hypothetical protein
VGPTVDPDVFAKEKIPFFFLIPRIETRFLDRPDGSLKTAQSLFIRQCIAHLRQRVATQNL